MKQQRESPVSFGGVALVPVSRAKEALCVWCNRCGLVHDNNVSLWGHDKSLYMHKRNGICDPKGVRYYGLPMEVSHA